MGRVMSDQTQPLGEHGRLPRLHLWRNWCRPYFHKVDPLPLSRDGSKAWRGGFLAGPLRCDVNLFKHAHPDGILLGDRWVWQTHFIFDRHGSGHFGGSTQSKEEISNG